jgi:hypothetical protein
MARLRRITNNASIRQYETLWVKTVESGLHSSHSLYFNTKGS